MPSSPPLSPASDLNEITYLKPTEPTAEPRTPMQLSSPLTSQGEDEAEDDVDEAFELPRNQLRPRALTSSVVRGEAANSLLELVKGGTISAAVEMCGL